MEKLAQVIRKLAAEVHKTAAVHDIILRQLGGRLVSMVGANTFISYKAEGDGNYGEGRGGVSFKFPNKGRGVPNYMKIILNENDLYDITFGRTRGMSFKVIKEFDNVQASQLKRLFEKTTGLYLSM